MLKDGQAVTPTGVSGAKYRQQIETSSELSEDERAAALRALDGLLEQVRAGELLDFRMVIRGCQRTTHGKSARLSGRARELEKRGYYVIRYSAKGSLPADVWRIVPEDGVNRQDGGHEAVFPPDLLRIPILTSCPPGGIVLDPFCGTGTAVLAALAHGRRGIGIDLSPEYHRVAEERISRWRKLNSGRDRCSKFTDQANL